MLSYFNAIKYFFESTGLLTKDVNNGLTIFAIAVSLSEVSFFVRTPVLVFLSL